MDKVFKLDMAKFAIRVREAIAQTVIEMRLSESEATSLTNQATQVLYERK